MDNSIKDKKTIGKEKVDNLNYTEDNIKKLSIKESLVNSLSTYTSIESPLGIISEGIFNATDELLNNKNDDKIINIIWEKGEFGGHKITIQDNGRGIPINSLKSATGELHVTGKSGLQKAENKSAYKQSVGVNGLGSKLISYLSHKATYTVSRDGKVVELSYIKGVQQKLKEIGKQEGKETYTKIEFEPNDEYFSNKITFKAILNLIKGIFFLLEGIKFILNNKITGEEFIFENTKGLSHYYDDVLEEEDSLITNPINIKTNIKDTEIDLTFGYQDKFITEMSSGINGWLLKEGGTIINGFKAVLVDSFKEVADQLKVKLEPIKQEHIVSGLTGFIHFFYNGYIKFEGQTKKKVLSTEFLTITKELKRLIITELLKNKEDAKKIIDRLNKTYEVLVKQDKSLNKIMQEANKNIKKAKGTKLIDMIGKKGEGELYIVEGDSAGGSMVQVRNPSKHAILKLKGKPKNVNDDTPKTIFGNAEIQSIIYALGGIGKDFDITKLKYKKIILTSDADSDGHHINSLLITFFHRFYPELFSQGIIYKALTPLFSVSTNKVKKYFYSEVEKNNYLKGKKNCTVTRFKGLGELNADQYEEFILGSKQKLQKITNKDIEKNSEIINDLMGKDSSKRWVFLNDYIPQEETEILKQRKQEIKDVLQDSMYDYATYVLENRAIPNMIDGLKNVGRRIIWNMWKSGIKSNVAKRKVTSIVGGTLNYHPHGDASIAGALTTITAKWRNNIPLLEGQGNFGNIFEHREAAPRYIEARLSSFVEDIYFKNLTKNTTNRQKNYDGRLDEPLEFPSVLPMSLILNNMGIAIGTKSEIPPFNLNEVINALNGYVKNPKNFDAKDYIKGPDFPTGGDLIIKNLENQENQKYILRGKIDTIKIKGKQHLMIKEITYGMDIEKFLDKLNEMLNEKDVKKQSRSLRSEVKKIKNSSGRGKVKILLELKPGADVNIVKEKIFKYTDLQSTVNFKPRLLKVTNDGAKEFNKYTLTKIIKDFVEYRKIILNRYFQEKIDLINKDISNYMAKALVIKYLDDLFKIIKKSNTRKDYITNLIKKFKIDESQAEYIANLKTTSLIKEEFDSIIKIIKSLQQEVESYKKIINNDKIKAKYMIKEWTAIGKKYGWERKTNIIEEDSIKKVNLNKNELKYKDEDYYIITTKTSLFKINTRKNLDTLVKKIQEKGQKILTISNSSTLENFFVVCNTEQGSLALPIKNFDIEEDKENIIQGFFNERINQVLGGIGNDKDSFYIFIYDNFKGYKISTENLYKERKFKINKRKLYKIIKVENKKVTFNNINKNNIIYGKIIESVLISKNENEIKTAINKKEYLKYDNSVKIKYEDKNSKKRLKTIPLKDIVELKNVGVGIFLFKEKDGKVLAIKF